MRTSELDYDLPEELIATEAVEPRDAARMLVVRRSGEAIEHLHVRDLPDLLEAEDLLVFNRSRVLPASLLGRREDTGGKVEGLYLRDGPQAGTWECLLKSRRFREGAPIRLLDRAGEPSPWRLVMLEKVSTDGAWRVRVEGPGQTLEILERVGRTPLPPYIRSARKRRHIEIDEARDRARYQTVYAREAGSVAAPTAGLHFTPRLLRELDARGVERGELLLHVGMGTFKPIEVEHIEDHPMHREWCAMDRSLRDRIVARVRGEERGRVIAVGTTSVRTIEAFSRRDDDAETIETDLMIRPGSEIRWTHGLLTNFHLPRSTLLALVAAFLDRDGAGGLERLLAIYREAIGRRYRFYSFGDAMLVLP